LGLLDTLDNGGGGGGSMMGPGSGPYGGYTPTDIANAWIAGGNVTPETMKEGFSKLGKEFASGAQDIRDIISENSDPVYDYPLPEYTPDSGNAPPHTVTGPATSCVS